jgi:hypothetical protein
MRLTLLLIFLAYNAVAQTLSFKDTHITVGHEYNIQDRNPNANSETGLVHKDGTTYLFTSQVWNGYWKSMGTMIKWNNQTGLYPASILTTEVQGEINRHLTTVGYVDTDKIYHLQEDRHSGMVEVWKTDRNGYGSTKLFQTAYGTHYARGLTYKLGDHFMNICQQDAVNLITLPFNGTIYEPHKNVVLPAQALKRVYAQKPIGSDRPDGWVHLTVMSSTSESHEEFFDIKTQDFNTWYTHDGSYSWVAGVSPPNVNTLRTNNAKMFGEANAPNGNLGDFISCVDDAGNVYAVAFRNYDRKLFFIDKYNGAYRQREFSVGDSISGYVHSNIVGVSERATGWMAKREDKFYLTLAVVDDTLRKFHNYESTDGINWNDQGDIFPDVHTHMYRVKGPENFNEIPVNTEFVFAGCDNVFNNQVGQVGEIYFRKAIFTDSTDLKIDSLNQITGARHIYHGSTTDKSGNGRNLTGTHTVNNGFISSSTGLQIPSISPYLADSQFTFVWKGKRKGNEYLLTFSDEGSTTKYFAIKFPSTESGGVMWQYVPASGSTNEGRVASVNDVSVNDVVTIVVTGNKYHVEFWIDGVQSNLELFGSTSTPTFMGRWLPSLSTYIDNGFIGAIKRTTTAATATEFAVNAYWPRVVTYDELQKIFKFLE